MTSGSSGSSYWVWGERGQQAFTVSPSTQSAVTWSLQEKTLITYFVSKERENLAENLDQRVFVVISNKVSSEKSPHPLSSFYLANEQGTQNSKNIC